MITTNTSMQFDNSFTQTNDKSSSMSSMMHVLGIVLISWFDDKNKNLFEKNKNKSCTDSIVMEY